MRFMMKTLEFPTILKEIASFAKNRHDKTGDITT